MRPQLLSTSMVAKALNLDQSQVAHLARQHGLGFKVGRNWLFSPADLRRLQKRPEVGRPKGG